VYFGREAAKSFRVYLKGREWDTFSKDKIEPQKGYITYYKKAWIGNWQDYRTGKRGGEKYRQCPHRRRLPRARIRTRLQDHRLPTLRSQAAHHAQMRPQPLLPSIRDRATRPSASAQF